jgi:hydrogenase maturation protease
LGNLLLKDDGIGVHAVRELQKDPPPGVRIVEVGTAVLDALHLFEWADRILAIDAMQAGGPPGTLYWFPIVRVEDGTPQASLHELNLLAALRFLPERKRPEIMILGVEPKIIDFGLDLTAEIQTALPQLVQVSKQILARWGLVPPTPEKRPGLSLGNTPEKAGLLF